MYERTVAVMLGAVLAVASGAHAGDAPTENVLVVLLDDWGVDWLGAYGEARTCTGSGIPCLDDGDCMLPRTCDGADDDPATPTIDRLVAEGLLFRNAWANPLCSPTRAAFLTGRHGFRTGVTEIATGGIQLQADELTLAEIILDPMLGSPAGHVPALIGKWHLAGGLSAPNEQGFVHYAGLFQGAVSDYFAWTRTVDGVSSPCSPGSPACPVESYQTTVMVDDALAWLAGRTDPWFLYFALVAPHEPFQVPPHSLLPAATLTRLPQIAGQPAPAGTVCAGPDRVECYRATIEAADAELARLLSTLTDPVTIILLGDNGTPRSVARAPFIGAHGKGTTHEGGVNVPFIIRHADGRAAGEETAALVHVVDIFPTVLELTGSCPPTDRVIDGVSLVPLLDDPDTEWAPTVYAERADLQGARDARFKLVRNLGVDELYDLVGDPPATPADAHEETDLLEGTCSGSGGTCHLDVECPPTETCDVPPLSAEAAASLETLRLSILALQGGSGTVPDGADVMGTPLTARRLPGGDIALAWGDSCSVEDVDYAVYEGALGDFSGHSPSRCSTGGVTTTMITPLAGSRYFLVAPAGATAEGSYGRDSDGNERPAGVAPCLPQLIRRCPWPGSCSD